MRVPLFSRFGGGGALLQIASIGTYTMSYYVFDCQGRCGGTGVSVAGGEGRAAAAAGDRFCSGYLLRLRESPDVMTRFEELTHRVRNAVRQKRAEKS